MPWTKVFLTEEDLRQFAPAEDLRSLSYVAALREGQEQLLETDDRVFIMGEGVDDPGGIFGSTLGLADKFGPERVMDTAIAENGMTGVAVGAALAGMRPIFVHMRMDFLPMCMDQIINHAAKWHYMTGGAQKVPLVVRSIIGRGWGCAAQHSQGLHGLFLQIPGLKIAMPATPYDAKGLLITAVEDGNPVMFIEHRWIYGSVGYVPAEKFRVPFGQGVVRKVGRDVTVVALSQMVYEAVKAARELDGEGISVEVIDPRTLKPLDEELICQSVKKTGRLVIADVACKTGGTGAEIACRVVEQVPEFLRAPVRRVNFAETPTPSSPVLEEAYYPSSHAIKATIKHLSRM
jgi:pyruvate/2-oxoglutarate/acetoin dehydrogenase E1 component